MNDGRPPLLLQVCPNDLPPFPDLCRYYAAAGRSLGWDAEAVMLTARGKTPERGFRYADGGFAAAVDGLLAGREPALTLCHRYRAYRVVVTSGRVGAPIVAVAHEFGFFRRRRRRWQRRLDRWRGRPPVAFAGVSDAVAEELAAVTGEMVVLPNGLDLARVDAMRLPREAALQTLGLSANAFHVGVVGRLHPKKQPLLALEGFAHAAARMPEARLTFVGDGELAGALKGRSKRLPVTFAGFVRNAASRLAAFDLLLVPSGPREAFGMVVLEAMAAGVPVLASTAPGPRFVLGDTGRWFDGGADALGQALLRAYGDWQAGTLAASVAAARARVEREFSLAAAAGRLQALAVTQ